jgi:hypothetical protein
MTTAGWIATALLAPFWWAVTLLTMTVLGDLSPWWRARVSRLFDWLERTRGEPPRPETVPQQSAA